MKPFRTGSLTKPDIGRLFAFAPTLIRGNGRRCFYGLSLPMKDACGQYSCWQPPSVDLR